MFLKECKKVIFSVTFLLYLLCVFAMYITQFDADEAEPISPPVQGSGDYGFIEKDLPEITMPNAVEGLVCEYLSGKFITYPIGFYKEVRLTEKKETALAEIITELSGLTKSELDAFTGFSEGEISYLPDGNGGFTAEYTEPVLPEIIIPEGLTYERFCALMNKADKIIGSGSKYSADNILHYFCKAPKTYEDALAEYNTLIYDEKISGCYARLYCDYMGIVLSILPVFVSASLVNMDKKSRIGELVYSRRISSARLVFTRYFACVTAMILPVALTAIAAQAKIYALYPGFEIGALTLPCLAAFWLIPNILIASAVGMVITELASPVFAVFAQGAWWIISLNSAFYGLTGSIGLFTLVCRHNSLYGADLFADDLGKFIFNRIFYTVLSLVLTGITAGVYEAKRRGRFNGLFSGGKNIAGKPKA